VILREILKFGALISIENKVFIGLMRFWAKNEGKNERKCAGNCQKRTRFDQKMTKVNRF